MSENRFLKNLNQPQPPAPPAVSRSAAERAAPRPEPVASEYDPIKRLADELSRHSRAIEGLTTRIDRLEERPRAATQAELQTLLAEAQKGVSMKISSTEIAGLVLPELTKGLPSVAEIKAAADAGASAITVAGTSAAAQIERSVSAAVERMQWASRSQADAFAGRVGFTSWRAAAVVFVGFALLVVGVSYYNRAQETALAQARAETQAVRGFTDWVKSQPPGKRLYDRYYNP